MITADRARQVLSYDPETGILVRKSSRQRPDCVGYPIGYKMKIGYLAASIEGKIYYLHRLAWFLHYGEWPSGEVDHINGIKDDNRIANLRIATRSLNGANRPKQKNNTSRCKGVYWHKKAQKWMVSIQVDGKQIYRGLFEDWELARIEATQAAIEHFGEFAHVD